MSGQLKSTAVTMRLRVANGYDDDGKVKIANRSLTDIAANLNNSDFCDVASAFASLQSHEEAGALRVRTDTFELD